MFFSPFSIAIISLGEERANLSSFRTFVRFVLVFFLFVSFSFWCLRRAAVCDCGTPLTFLLSFLWGVIIITKDNQTLIHLLMDRFKQVR